MFLDRLCSKWLGLFLFKNYISIVKMIFMLVKRIGHNAQRTFFRSALCALHYPLDVKKEFSVGYILFLTGALLFYFNCVPTLTTVFSTNPSTRQRSFNSIFFINSRSVTDLVFKICR